NSRARRRYEGFDEPFALNFFGVPGVEIGLNELRGTSAKTLYAAGVVGPKRSAFLGDRERHVQTADPSLLRPSSPMRRQPHFATAHKISFGDRGRHPCADVFLVRNPLLDTGSDIDALAGGNGCHGVSVKVGRPHGNTPLVFRL